MTGKESEPDCLVDLANAVREKNFVDAKVARLLDTPALPGHFGEFVAGQIFDIELSPAANQKAFDGRFRGGNLDGKTVNIKYYTKNEGLLDLKKKDGPDYYLVMTGPKGKAESSRGTTRPWVIESVFLFEAKDLLGKLTVEIGTATSVKSELWDEAEIYRRNSSPLLSVTDAQRKRLALFAASAIG